MGINECREHSLHWRRPNQLSPREDLVDDDEPQVKETEVPPKGRAPSVYNEVQKKNEIQSLTTIWTLFVDALKVKVKPASCVQQFKQGKGKVVARQRFCWNCGGNDHCIRECPSDKHDSS